MYEWVLNCRYLTQGGLAPVCFMNRSAESDIVTVQGVVTAPTDNFFDTVYIQDVTGGVALYDTQGKELPVGTVVIAAGGVQYFEGELELAYEDAENSGFKVEVFKWLK